MFTLVSYWTTHTHKSSRRYSREADPDGALKETVRIKIRHHRNTDLFESSRPNSVLVVSSGSALVNELSEESDQLRFLRATCLVNLKDSVGLIFERIGHEDFYPP